MERVGRYSGFEFSFILYAWPEDARKDGHIHGLSRRRGRWICIEP